MTVSSSVAIGSSAWPRSGTDTARSIDAARARPHLGAIQVHRLLQRLRELEQELVERQRAREPAAERADHLVGRVLLAVHPAVRVVLEPLAGRHPEQRGGRRTRDRQSEHAALATVERPTERGDDGERHRARRARPDRRR